VAGTGGYDYAGDGGPAVNAEVSPKGLAVDQQGQIYFTDSCCVRRIANGSVSTVAGIPGRNGPAVDGPTSSAVFDSPWGVAVGPHGDIFVADYGNGVVQRISNGMVTTVTSPHLPRSLGTVFGLAVDAVGTIYVSVIGRDVVWRIVV
jgi:streptogramin lyase